MRSEHGPEKHEEKHGWLASTVSVPESRLRAVCGPSLDLPSLGHAWSHSFGTTTTATRLTGVAFSQSKRPSETGNSLTPAPDY